MMTQRTNAPDRLRQSRALLALVVTLPAFVSAQEAAPEYAQPDTPLLKWLLVIGGLVAIFFVLYKIIYPYFLRYYSHDFSRTIFWTLWLLYTLTWLFLSSYLLEYGFYVDWLKWIGAFLAVIWLIAALGLLMRRKPA